MMENICEMVCALKNIGKEWHKNDMHRFYIDIASADRAYRSFDERKHGGLPVNRFEINNGKVWIDLETGKIETKSIRNSEEMIEDIYELVELIGQK